jgi:hypothetical protein
MPSLLSSDKKCPYDNSVFASARKQKAGKRFPCPDPPVDEAGKPNMATEFWSEVAVSKAIERAAHILDLIDAKWPAP